MRRSLPSFLVRNDYSYCFRYKIPPDLRPIIGKTELRYSLHTGSLKEAKSKSLLIAGRVKALMVKIAKGGHNMDKEEINALVRRYIERSLAEAEDYRVSRTTPIASSSIEADLFACEEVMRDREDELVRCDYRYIGDKLVEFLKTEGVGLDQESDEYRVLLREFLKGEIDAWRIELHRMRGDYQYEKSILSTPAIRVHGNGLPASIQAKPVEFGTVVDAYWGEAEPTWKERTRIEYLSGKRLMEEMIGRGTPLHTITYATMRECKSLLMRLPKNASKLKKWRNLPLYKFKTIDVPAGDRLSSATINKYLTLFGAVFNYAKQNHYMDYNPAEGLHVKDTRRKDEIRDVFDKEDLQKLFHSEEYLKDTFKRAWQFWLPVLGLFTGCRLEELSQLDVADIHQIDGVWVIDINEKGRDKSVKNGEKRLVPIHPVLIDMGFLNYHKRQAGKKHKKVFDNLKRIKERYGHYPSRWFSKYREKCGVVSVDGKKVFHSFRHTFTNQLKQRKVPEDIISEIVGHASRSITMNRYGKVYEPATLYMDGVCMSEYDLDLSHLKRSRWTQAPKE